MAEHQPTPKQRLTYKEAAELYRQSGINHRLTNYFAAAWLSEEATADATVDDGWEKSITIWGYYGLDYQEIDNFIDSIVLKGDKLGNDDKWRYFCGCAWNTVRIIKDIAENGGIDE